MRISEFYKKQPRTISFEFFPPKTEEAEEKLFETVAQLKSLRPSFVSVTYGAMGSTRNNTLRIVSRIKKEAGIEAAAHLTCVGHTRDEIETILGDLQKSQVENIVALRGDPPKGEVKYKPLPGGLSHASDLVQFIRRHPRFSKTFDLAVAGYPETHVECRDPKKDLEHLKYKVDQGADAVITQLFFDNRDYFDFVERAQAAGINIPIIPGIMPVTQGNQIEKFASMCGAKIPVLMKETILRCGEDQKAVEAFGVDYATGQCAELLRQGVPGIHFYTLNKSYATQQIAKNLSL